MLHGAESDEASAIISKDVVQSNLQRIGEIPKANIFFWLLYGEEREHFDSEPNRGNENMFGTIA